jgi:hypothetical protein
VYKHIICTRDSTAAACHAALNPTHPSCPPTSHCITRAVKRGRRRRRRRRIQQTLYQSLIEEEEESCQEYGELDAEEGEGCRGGGRRKKFISIQTLYY